jgi:hypothetical protein
VNDLEIDNNESNQNGWKDGSGCVVFLLVFMLGYSGFKVNKMEDRLE